jgi:hypothetical protein
LILTIHKLDEVLKDSTIKDELVGDTILLDAEKMDLFMNRLKLKVLDTFYEEQHRKDKRWKPVKDSLKFLAG